MNFAFSTGAATISLPNDAALGAAAGAWLNDKAYTLGGLVDANSDPTDPFEGLDNFFEKNEYFSSIEIGWTTSRERAYLDNIHLTLWHADELKTSAVASGWGAVFSFARFIGDQIMPFLRAGYADEGGSLLEKSVSAGLGYRPNPDRPTPGNLLGCGANWGKPNKAVFVNVLKDQFTFEFFYRLQVTRELAVTPDIQLLVNPALNPHESSIFVFGLRGRLAL